MPVTYRISEAAVIRGIHYPTDTVADTAELT